MRFEKKCSLQAKLAIKVEEREGNREQEKGREENLILERLKFVRHC